MNLINSLLNLACIFLWIDWVSARSGRPHSALSLASTVRPADRASGRNFGSLAAFLLILLLRPLFYYSVGPAVNWTAALNYVAVAIPFRSDLLGRMFVFSAVSVGGALGIYYCWMFFLAAIHRSTPTVETEPMVRFIRAQLGFFDKVPWWLKLRIPSLCAALAWILLSLRLVELELLPEAQSNRALRSQATSFAIAALLSGKWLLIAIFLLHMLNLYVYLGTHPLWPFISTTARKLLYPFSFVRFGKLDLSPVLGAVAVYALAELFLRPLAIDLFQRHIV